METKLIRGKVLKYGDNINTDLISPSRYPDLKGKIQHAMEGVDPEFTKKVQPGDIIVAGPNFGSGSSRETAPVVLKENGIAAVISPLFARIFYRNSINVGLPVLICSQADEISDGDTLEINPIEGTIKNITTGRLFVCDKLPAKIMELIEMNGLIPQLEKRLLGFSGQV